MVISLWRAFALPWGPSSAKPVPEIDFSRLSEHDLADLNLPASLRARIELQRNRRTGIGRW